MSEVSSPIAADGVLDPKLVRIQRTDRGTLNVDAHGHRYEDVSVRRAFPLEMAEAFIGLIAADGEEIGMMEDPSQLDSASRDTLEQELARTYFLPVITHIGELREDYGVIEADLETSSGPRHLEIRGIRASIRVLSRKRLLIEDTDGNRYELRDYHLLPKLTREILGL